MVWSYGVMGKAMNFCLSDLVPPLRWSDAARMERLGEPPDLPEAWWRSLPIGRVLAVLNAEALGELLTDLAMEHWPAAAVGDILPALHVLDPDEADDPQVAIALDRVGSWPGLLSLTSRELADQPFIKTRPVLAALFTAVFVRLTPAELPKESIKPSVKKPSVGKPAKGPIKESIKEPVQSVEPEPVEVPGDGAEHELPALIDAAFANLDDKTWMVAQNRVFTDAPTAVEGLAKLLAVSPGIIQTLETALRARVSKWLASPEAAPYNEHLERVSKLLGVAAPKSRLLNAADWHEQELHSLDVPAWQFVLGTLTGYQVSGDWLVAGDLADLHDRTRGLIVNSDRPPTVTRALELVSSLGIHPDVAKEWLENVPQLRIQSTSSNGVHPQAPPSPAKEDRKDKQDKQDERQGMLKDVTLTRRCFRQPDGRWWLRVDVSTPHLGGAEVSLPTGFASYLGLSPGDSRRVRSVAGEVTLAWQSHPALGSLQQILQEVAAKEGSHVFLTLSDEGTLRVRHLPAAGGGDATARALRLVGYTAPGGTRDQAIRVIATRIGLAGPVGQPELLARLRERGDRDLLSLMG